MQRKSLWYLSLSRPLCRLSRFFFFFSFVLLSSFLQSLCIRDSPDDSFALIFLYCVAFRASDLRVATVAATCLSFIFPRCARLNSARRYPSVRCSFDTEIGSERVNDTRPETYNCMPPRDLNDINKSKEAQFDYAHELLVFFSSDIG